MLWVSTKAFDAIAIASTTIIIIMVIIISAQALCQCTSAYTCEFQGVLRVLSTYSFEYRAIKTLKFFDQIISGKKLNRIYHFLKMPYFCWIASGPICHIDATFLTKPLQKSQFYNHEKLQRKPIFGRGLKIFILQPYEFVNLGFRTNTRSRLRCLLHVKGLVICLKLGMVWQYSSVQTKYNKGRFKVMATYLQQ